MKKAFPILIMIVFITLFFCLYVFINSRTETLIAPCASIDISDTKTYTLSLPVEDETKQIEFSLCIKEDQPQAALIVSGLNTYFCYQDGDLIFSSSEYDPYAQFQIIPLNEETGTPTDILIQSEGNSPRVREILTGKLNAPPKILLTNIENASYLKSLSYAFSVLIIGLYFFMFTICILLYGVRPKEKSFLLAAMVSLVMVLTCSLNGNTRLFRISFGLYYILRPLITVLPIVVHVSLCIYLLNDSLSGGFKKVFSLTNVLLLTITMVLIQAFSPRSWYHLFLLISYLITSEALIRAMRCHFWDALILSIGYMACAALILFIYLINVWHLFPIGCPFIIFRTTQIGYLFTVISCMTVITIRLGQSFNNSEQLSLQLSELNTELDYKVKERTTQLQKEQEQRQHMMLSLIHDLRNPVFVVRGSLDRLKVEGEQKQIKSVAISRLDTLEHLIEDLLLSYKLENNKLQTSKELVVIYDLLSDAADALRLSCKESVTVSQEGDKRVAAWVDPFQLRQAIDNIADNARKHIAPDGEITLSVIQDGSNAVIRISDNGSGIKPEALPLVFDRFYQEKPCSEHGSSGIGLYIAKGLVELNGGTIHAASTPNEKTTFTITIPMINMNEEIIEE